MPFLCCRCTFSFSCVSLTVFPSDFFLQSWPSFLKNLTDFLLNRKSEPPAGHNIHRVKQHAWPSAGKPLWGSTPWTLGMSATQMMFACYHGLISTWWLLGRFLAHSEPILPVSGEQVNHLLIAQPGSSGLCQNVSQYFGQLPNRGLCPEVLSRIGKHHSVLDERYRRPALYLLRPSVHRPPSHILNILDTMQP